MLVHQRSSPFIQYTITNLDAVKSDNFGYPYDIKAPKAMNLDALGFNP